jgi:putative membrane protein
VFGSRASLIVDLTFAVTLLAPVITLVSMYFAKHRAHELHKRVQIGLLVVCILAVLALEVEIRLAGGSGVFLSQSSAGQAALARAFLGTHISGAVITYGVWIYLAVASTRRYPNILPGTFSRRHKRIGKVIFAGLCFTAVTAIGMYFLAFVA